MKRSQTVIIMSLFILLNSAFNIMADNYDFSEDDNHNTVTAEITDLGQNCGISPADKNIIHSDSINNERVYDDNETVRVSIIVKGLSTLDKGYSSEKIASNRKAIAYRNTLQKKQDDIIAEIKKKDISINVKWNLTLAANIISAEVLYKDIYKIKELPSVEEVIIEKYYQCCQDEINTAVSTSEMIFAQDVWANGYTGAGSLIAVIDTGTNQDHISFAPEGLQYSLTKDGKSLSEYNLLTKQDISEVISQLNAPINADSVYKNLKIPFAYNYIDKNYTTDHDSDNQTEHGSHVAGIAAANRYIKVNNQWKEAAEEVSAVGVAPDAQIITMKVFGKNGGAYDSDYMAAIEDAIILGADSINLSLGSTEAGFAYSNEYQNILNKLAANNSVVCISAGNSSAWNDNPYISMTAPAGYLYRDDINFNTMGAPGSFVDALTVASADNIKNMSAPLLFNSTLKVDFTESSYRNPAIKTVAGTYDYVYIDSYGTAADYLAVNSSLSLSGKVVIVNRGGGSFYKKGDECALYNPKAVIIANDQDENISMDLSDLHSAIPMVMISLVNANAIKTASDLRKINGLDVYTGTVKISANGKKADQAQISNFSSWGTSGALLIKPEITAPGGNIYSVNGLTDNRYETMSGTSMAAPHISGMAALLAQYIKEKNLEEKTNLSKRQLTNALLMSTATPLKDENNQYYSILAQGSGLANVYNAAVAKAVITVNQDATASYADGKVKVELGEDKERTGKYTYSFDIFNASEKPITYNLHTDLFTQWMKEETYNGYGEEPVTVGFLSKSVSDFFDYDITYETSDFICDVNKDTITDVADVQMILDIVTGKADSQMLNYDNKAADIDADGIISSYDAMQLMENLNHKAAVNTVNVKAGERKTVVVTVQINNKEEIDTHYPKGCYIEGFTFITAQSDDEGVIADVQYSIPVLGFYGSWTDPSMFDADRLVERSSGIPTNMPYFNNPNTNSISISYPGETDERWFMGNPYIDDQHFDRFAISDATKVNYVSCQLIRSASSLASYAAKMTEDGKRKDIKIYSSSNFVDAPYYDYGDDKWYGVSPKAMPVNKTIAEMGFEDGDMIDFGVVAVAEYYAMQLNNNTSSSLNNNQISQLLADNILGEGAYIHYPMMVDSTAPQLISVTYDKTADTVSVTAKDNYYIAYLALRMADGMTVIADCVPEQSEAGQTVTKVFDVSGISFDNVLNIFIGDYAGNESNCLADFGSEGDYDKATMVVISPKEKTIYGIGSTAQLKADVYPSFISNKDVIWTSSNNSIATVNDNGLVTAISKGSVKIKAVSTSDKTVYDEADIIVVETSPINENISAIVNTATGARFVDISLNNSSYTPIANADRYYISGGRSGNYIITADTATSLYITEIDNEYAQQELGSLDDPDLLPLDFAAISDITLPDNSVEKLDAIWVTPTGNLIMIDISAGMLSGWTMDYAYVAICYGGTIEDEDGLNYIYYALKENGDIDRLYIFGSSEGVSLASEKCNRITGITVNSDFPEAYSLSCLNNNQLLLADCSERVIYLLNIDSTGNSIKPVLVCGIDVEAISCLYNDTYDTLQPSSASSFRKNTETVRTADITGISISENGCAGSINRIKYDYVNISPISGVVYNKTKPLASVNASEAEIIAIEKNGIITISSSEDINNGKIILTYDSSCLVFDSVSSECEYTSVYDNNGTITFAFVSSEALSSSIATFNFEKTCMDTEVTVEIKEVDDRLNITDREIELTLTADENRHNFVFDSFIWSDYNAKAKYICSADKHTEIYYDATVTSEVTIEPTFDSPGIRTYTAYYDGHTDTKEEIIEKLSYLLGDVNADNKVTDADAIHLLMYTFFPDEYPINQPGDFNKDGKITDADAIHLLMYTFFPEEYPLD